MRTNAKERKENAQKFYRMFMQSNCNQSAIVVKRTDSRTNPNISRCQFVAVASTLAFMESPIVIAESTLGINGCFRELLQNIKKCPQKDYFEDGFNDWLKEKYGFEIIYKDGLVFMLEKESE